MTATLRIARDAVTGVARDFVWQALRDGAIRVRGLSPATVAVVVVAFVLLVLTIVSFAAGDLLRTGRELLVVPNGTPGRGTMVPGPLVPATFVLVAVGSSLLLAGALHAALAVRVAVLLVFASVAATFLGLADALEGTSGVAVWPGWLLAGAVPVVFALRWRGRPRPGLEFALMLALVGATLAFSAHAIFRSDEISGSGFALQELSLLLGLLVGLSTPLLFVAGLDIIGFGLDLATWTLRFIDRRIAQWAVNVGLAVLGAWRLRDVVANVVRGIDDAGAGDTLLPLLGATVLVAALWTYWWAIGTVAGRRPGTATGDDVVDHGSARVRLPLGLAYAGVPFLVIPLLFLLQALGYLGIADVGFYEALSSLAGALNDDWVITTYRVVLGLVLVVVGMLLARRGRASLAMFLGAVGVSDLVAQLFANVDPLHGLLWDGPAPLDAVWVTVFAAAGVWWLVRRRLTEVRAERLFFVVLASALLSQFEFVADPLAPLLGFAGVGFIVFGLVWGFLTGGGWANEDSARFPRSSRVYLYLGYSLFSVALLNWFAATHDVAELSGIEFLGTSGVTLLGYPLLYALFTLVLAGAVVDRPIDEPEGGVEEVSGGG
jgi:hypothetical protein